MSAKRLLRLAVESSWLDEVCDHVADIGSLVGAYDRHDERAVASFWGRRHTFTELVFAGTTVLVAEQQRSVVGAICVGFPWKLVHEARDAERVMAATATLAKLNAVGVDESARGAGIGRALVDVATELLDEAGYGVVFGQCAPTLRSFYASAGYRVTDPLKPLIVSEGTPSVIAIHSDDPSECMIGRVLHPLTPEHCSWRAPGTDPQLWVPLQNDGQTDINVDGPDWTTASVQTAQGALEPLLRVPLPESASRSLGFERVDVKNGQLSAPLETLSGIQIRVLPGRLIFVLNDPTASQPAQELMELAPLTEENSEWLERANERGGTVMVSFDPQRPSSTRAAWVEVSLPEIQAKAAELPPRVEDAESPRPRTLWSKLFGRQKSS
ncbi:GNAT family N-acetyltransferase [Agreia sp. PsM10]|uniref:GNAT family N-acetyltransferase n=1 Tax=Agreia sp. PsM10 TaxID=3030533 RepID=UPI00263BE800|nr:GNAT family N-acetyltransferase [Agreia sp. PsM10]MDN4641786.1 GNAT family N-acetyltransferase [Agreia sp. PsM10]